MSTPYVILRSGAEVAALQALAQNAGVNMVSITWTETGIISLTADINAGIGAWYYQTQMCPRPFLNHVSGPASFPLISPANRPTILTNSPAHFISYIRAARARSQSAAAVMASVRPELLNYMPFEVDL